MNNKRKLAVLAVGAAFWAVMLGGGSLGWAQTAPADAKKLYLEIAGDYDFDIQGQGISVNFFEKDGKLWGAPPGETPEELLPVQDSALKFQVFPNSQQYDLEFVRNENKEIDKCILKGGGMEIVGVKRAKIS